MRRPHLAAALPLSRLGRLAVASVAQATIPRRRSRTWLSGFLAGTACGIVLTLALLTLGLLENWP